MSKKIILIGDINIDLALKGVKNLSNIKMGAELEISEYNLNIKIICTTIFFFK